ncbi:MAG: hypothetical protein HOY78_30850, partial [Saccharothrix sp.]|nr:hypothetical protein [Saccharothrix sp.]
MDVVSQRDVIREPACLERTAHRGEAARRGRAVRGGGTACWGRPVRRGRRTVAKGSALVVVVVVLGALFPVCAGAEPPELSETLARYWEASGEAERANDRLLAAQDALHQASAAAEAATENARQTSAAADRARAVASSSEADARQAAAARDRLQAEVDTFIEATYLGLRLDVVGAILSSRDPVEFLGTANLLDSVAEDVTGTVHRHGDAVSAAQDAAARAAAEGRAADEAGKS